MVPQIIGTTTQAIHRTTLTTALEAVKADSTQQQTVIEGNVQAALTDGNSCMMGGWTS
ncbi:hypothetical protein QIS99_31375 [Streptomyces sp. B-S-A8]|uniref:Uncharacterized protein n=1 Tax=Streptomyces solicavernae TaxID=3043614 RepID=A0ABT6S1U6_9ACTN|nr:hypothetical protein [Streptomyces sp. B-S-A8]MDI3390662.1 hypothetical protein [Streptomyces sp. B-S-A8]